MFARFVRLLALAFLPLVAFFSAAIAWGQVDPTLPPTGAEWQDFFTALGGVQGMSTMALVALVVQGLMLMFRGPLSNLAGAGKLVVVTGLTLVGGVVSLHAQGLDWVSCLMQSTTLAAMQVFLHQVWTQFKPGDSSSLNGGKK